MVLDDRKVRKNLKKKGFVENEKADHRFFEFYHNEKMICKTKVSHNSQDIDDYLISNMAKQVKLSKNDFIALVECTLSQNGYEEKLRISGLIE
ncbi:MAG: hypothetical protein LCH37_15340 [Bacteroidetes bacterium]|nr:hypothetical protein [Bacteroidota bacterium]